MDDEARTLLAELVSIDSVNPRLVPGGAGEAEIARFVGLARLVNSAVWRSRRRRPSVIARARGRGGGRTLLLCGHLDTVGVDGMADHSLRASTGDRLYGRGAYDMKAGLAAALLACREAARAGWPATSSSPPSPTRSSRASGSRRRWRSSTRTPRSSPSRPSSRSSSRTRASVDRGRGHRRAAHGSRPQLGVDAIVKTGPVLIALAALDEHGDPRAPAAGPGSVHASMIEGGASCRAPRPAAHPARAPHAAWRDRGRRRGRARGAVDGRRGRGDPPRAARPRAVRGDRDQPIVRSGADAHAGQSACRTGRECLLRCLARI